MMWLISDVARIHCLLSRQQTTMPLIRLHIVFTVKFLSFRMPKKLCYNLPKIETKRPNLTVLCQKDANGIANSEDPDQTAPLGAV